VREPQVGVDARGAVDTAMRRVDRADPLGQPSVAERAFARRVAAHA